MPSKKIVAELPIKPKYVQKQINDSLLLESTRLSFNFNEKEYSDTAQITISFSPREKLEFICNNLDANPLFGMLLSQRSHDLLLKFPDHCVEVESFCSATGQERGNIIFAPKQRPVTISKASNEIVSTVFHLFNFPDIDSSDSLHLMTGPPPHQSYQNIGNVVLTAEDWTITIQATENAREFNKQLQQNDGFAITHVGEIRKKDDKAYSSSDLDDVLSCLHYYLSFVLGRWCAPALPKGSSISNLTVYEQWGLGSSASGIWNGSKSWLIPLQADMISEVFPGFWKLWKNPLWQKPLIHAIYWYIESNDSNVDYGIILAQTALELLSWNYCVKDRMIVSEGAFSPNKLIAADKLRMLFSTMNIPRAIPSQLSISRMRKGNAVVQDGMEALTMIRNSLVHPGSTAVLESMFEYDAWRYSLWLIEMAILRLCNYSGKYGNRLVTRFSFQSEDVPWTTSA